MPKQALEWAVVKKRKSKSFFIWAVVIILSVSPFILSWMSFSFPLTYCDSIDWAPSYYGRISNNPVEINSGYRGWVIPAYYHTLGLLSTLLDSPNIIGFLQAAMMATMLLWLHSTFIRRLSIGTLLLLGPALLFSSLRYAIYSQTILSEGFTIVLYLAVVIFILQRQITITSTMLIALSLVIIIHARFDSIYLLPLVLIRYFLEKMSWRRFFFHVGIFTILFISSHMLIARAEGPARKLWYPIGKIMVMAEWVRYSKPPQNRIAEMVDSDLTKRFAKEMSNKNISNISSGLWHAERYYHENQDMSWSTIFQFLLYQVLNRPIDILWDRLKTFADLFATSFSAHWSKYEKKSNYYSTYDNVLSKWTMNDIEHSKYSCSKFADAQSNLFKRSAIHSSAAFSSLQWLHRIGWWYSYLILRPITYLSLLLGGILIVKKKADRQYLWILSLFLFHLAMRAVLICADERYQLPVDCLMIWWIIVTFTEWEKIIFCRTEKLSN